VARTWRKSAGGHVGAIVLVIAGGMLIVIGLLARRDSLARTGIGAGLLLSGVFADRLRRAKVGPAGAEIELERRARESTTELVVRSSATAQLPFALPQAGQVTDVHRVALANEVVSFLTHPRDGPLVGCAFQLYLFDVDADLIVPVLEPGHPGPSPGFAVGEGAVGKAWETGGYAIAEGAEASDESFALSGDKQVRYTDVAVVAAMPVTNAAGRVISVLSAASTDAHCALRTDEGLEALVALADAIARVLVDLLKWFTDEYDEHARERM